MWAKANKLNKSDQLLMKYWRFQEWFQDRPEFKIHLTFVSLLLGKENIPALFAFEISFLFQTNIILDIKDKEILQVTILSICLVVFLCFVAEFVLIFLFCFFPDLKATE